MLYIAGGLSGNFYNESTKIEFMKYLHKDSEA